MPQRKQPETLAKLCAKLIFTKIDLFRLVSKTEPDWSIQCLREYIHNIRNHLESGNKSKMFVASGLLEEWTATLFKEKRLTLENADTLLTGRIKVLNLSRLDGPLTEEDVQVLRVASERCPVN